MLSERILLLTFTDKAAKEVMRLVADLLGQELASLRDRALHAIGNRKKMKGWNLAHPTDLKRSALPSLLRTALVTG